MIVEDEQDHFCARVCRNAPRLLTVDNNLGTLAYCLRASGEEEMVDRGRVELPPPGFSGPHEGGLSIAIESSRRRIRPSASAETAGERWR
jgi:hypothetical protein